MDYITGDTGTGERLFSNPSPLAYPIPEASLTPFIASSCPLTFASLTSTLSNRIHEEYLLNSNMAVSTVI